MTDSFDRITTLPGWQTALTEAESPGGATQQKDDAAIGCAG